MIKYLVPNITIGAILLQSTLFTSKSDVVRMIRQRGVKVNGVLVEDFNEPLELGDFLNFIWLPKATEIIYQDKINNYLMIAKGKSRTIVRVWESKIEVLI